MRLGLGGLELVMFSVHFRNIPLSNSKRQSAVTLVSDPSLVRKSPM